MIGYHPGKCRSRMLLGVDISINIHIMSFFGGGKILPNTLTNYPFFFCKYNNIFIWWEKDLFPHESSGVEKYGQWDVKASELLISPSFTVWSFKKDKSTTQARPVSLENRWRKRAKTIKECKGVDSMSIFSVSKPENKKVRKPLIFT